MINEIIQGPALENLQKLEANSIDLIVTDPPYGYNFMGKDWDKAVVNTDTWRQCLRVLKPGAFAFIMSSPRQDVFCKMMLNLIDAGFRTDFSSIYWTYASGFPKAADVSKLVDKRNGKNYSDEFNEYLNQKRNEKNLSLKTINEALGYGTKGGGMASYWMGISQIKFNGFPSIADYNKIKSLLDLDNRYDNLINREEAEREKTGEREIRGAAPLPHYCNKGYIKFQYDYTKPATEQAKQLEGSYAGFQPKPAVELILVVMKPLSEKSYVDQALANKKGITWLDSCRIPYQSEQDRADNGYQYWNQRKGVHDWNLLKVRQGDRKETVLPKSDHVEPFNTDDKGRFPANLLVEDDVLNDGKNHTYSGGPANEEISIRDNDQYRYTNHKRGFHPNDSGSFSRYFSLDAWAKTLPFLIVPKASKSEKNKGCDEIEGEVRFASEPESGKFLPTRDVGSHKIKGNYHPTVKPLKLMSYLITMGSREGDTVLDPFCGSGTVLIAAHELHRQYIGIEISAEYCEIVRERLRPHKEQKRIQEFTNA